MPKKHIKENSKSDWKKHVDGWRQSGQSQTQYCRENRLNLNTFRYHVHKGEEAGSKFVRLSGPPATVGSEPSLQITIRAGQYSGAIQLKFTPEVRG